MVIIPPWPSERKQSTERAFRGCVAAQREEQAVCSSRAGKPSSFSPAVWDLWEHTRTLSPMCVPVLPRVSQLTFLTGWEARIPSPFFPPLPPFLHFQDGKDGCKRERSQFLFCAHWSTAAPWPVPGSARVLRVGCAF